MSRIEGELQGRLLLVFEELFKEKKYQGYSAVIERGRADITILYKNREVLFLELKDPIAPDGKSVENSRVVQREKSRAKRLNINYFGITNFTEAIIYSLKKGISQERKENFENRNFPTLQEIDRYRNSGNFTNLLKNKFINLAKWYLSKAESIIQSDSLPQQSLDENFILKIKSSINKYGYFLSTKLFEKFEHSKAFRQEIKRYFISQQWTIPTGEQDLDNFSHIAILVYISKLIFYKAMQDSNRWNLEPIEIGDSENLEEKIWNYFENLKRETKDFELLIGKREDIEFRVIFIDSEIAYQITDEVLKNSKKYDFSKMKEDIIGRIFEELIKPDERHKLGQYFTSSAVVKTINSFTIRRGNEKVLDPSCGSGAFLISAYERKKRLGNRDHAKLLSEIYGVDISSYPVFLSMLNLAIRNLEEKSYPRVIHKDFFKVGIKLESGKTSLEKILDSDGKEQKIEFSNFDTIIGNPPYTRQEEIDSYNPNQKEQILEILKIELGDFAKAIPGRTSIYGYFFYRAKMLLKDGGYLGYITSNSWLDVDFGEVLQKFLLDNFRVIAIIDSKVERFFHSADVNTNITILQKLKVGEKLDKNFQTKFVYLKKPLLDILEKFGGEDNFRDFVETCKEIFEDEYIRIYPISQLKLHNESKWSKFLKAPKVYWDILERGKGKWQRLGDVAKIRRGFTTGANEFFYLQKIEENDDLWLMRNGIGEEYWIEKQFLKPVIKSPREIDGYVVKPENLKYYVLLVNGFERREIEERFPNLAKYLRRGEERGYHERSTTRSRERWWELGEQEKQDFILLRFRDKRNWTPVIENDVKIGDVVFTGRYLDKNKKLFYDIFLNSTFTVLNLYL
ncbi:MAG TPA: SAM-dependent DNA methyltransferase [Campylobacterales bacterium]|nr:SAM-dependent DNA methyltransferase [Campylobacterales bacterium]